MVGFVVPQVCGILGFFILGHRLAYFVKTNVAAKRKVQAGEQVGTPALVKGKRHENSGFCPCAVLFSFFYSEDV